MTKAFRHRRAGSSVIVLNYVPMESLAAVFLSGTAAAAFDDGWWIQFRAGELVLQPADSSDSWVLKDPYSSPRTSSARRGTRLFEDRSLFRAHSWPVAHPESRIPGQESFWVCSSTTPMQHELCCILRVVQERDHAADCDQAIWGFLDSGRLCCIRGVVCGPSTTPAHPIVTCEEGSQSSGSSWSFRAMLHSFSALERSFAVVGPYMMVGRCIWMRIDAKAPHMASPIVGSSSWIAAFDDKRRP